MTEQEIRAAHPDWTDEQVTAEVARLAEKPEPAATPPASGTGEQDAAFARMRRETEDANKRAKAAEDKLAEEARKKAEEDGQFKELADKEKARADGLEAKQRETEQRRNAERAAGDLKFKDPGYALYMLAAENVDLSDAAAVKAALDRIAADRKDLLGGVVPAPSGGPAGGSKQDPPGLTREQLAGMSPKQIAALDPKIVNEALAS
jgi:membrane protein involved in colicin uptake